MAKNRKLDTGFAIWLLRKSRGMSQRDLAVRVGTTRQQISDLEIYQQPTIRELRRIAKGLRVPPSVLVGIAEARRRAA